MTRKRSIGSEQDEGGTKPMGRKKKQSPPPAFATDGSWHTHHVILFDDLLNSPAYIALSAHAKEAYTILMQEYKGPYTGPKVICPYSTFQKKGMRSEHLIKSTAAARDVRLH